MTPELHPLPRPLPTHLRWRHTQRRTAWLFDGQICVGSLGFAGYGRASGVTSRGIWHLHRIGVLHPGITLAPADGRQPPLLMTQAWDLAGKLALDGDVVHWRGLGQASWCFERERDGARYCTFTPSGVLQADTEIETGPAVAALDDPSPLLLLGAFLVRLAVDDVLVIAGA